MLYNVIIEYPKGIEEKLKKICEDIKVTSEKKNESFDYKFQEGKLIIVKPRERTAYSVGFWFKQRGIYVDDYDENDREKVRKNRKLKRRIRFEVIKDET